MSTIGTTRKDFTMKNATITLRIDEETKKVWSTKAENSGLSLTDYIVTAVEDSYVVNLKEGPEIAEALMDLRISLDNKGLTPNVAKNLQALIFKIDGLIDSFPQNKPKSGEDLCEEDSAEDENSEEFDYEGGDFI